MNDRLWFKSNVARYALIANGWNDFGSDWVRDGSGPTARVTAAMTAPCCALAVTLQSVSATVVPPGENSGGHAKKTRPVATCTIAFAPKSWLLRARSLPRVRSRDTWRGPVRRGSGRGIEPTLRRAAQDRRERRSSPSGERTLGKCPGALPITPRDRRRRRMSEAGPDSGWRPSSKVTLG